MDLGRFSMEGRTVFATEGARMAAQRVPEVRVNGVPPRVFDRRGPDGQQRPALATSVEREGKPDDVGWAALLLASDPAAFINGQTFVVNGG